MKRIEYDNQKTNNFTELNKDMHMNILLNGLAMCAVYHKNDNQHKNTIGVNLGGEIVS